MVLEIIFKIDSQILSGQLLLIYNLTMVNEEMDFIQMITLSPFEKYTRFNKFPWKFIFHLLLVFLCTYQAIQIVQIQDKHTRIQEQVFANLYLKTGEDDGISQSYYSLSDFCDIFFGTINQTEALSENLLQYSNIDNVTYELQVYYSQLQSENQKRIIFTGDSQEFIEQLQQIPLHQGNNVEMKKFIEDVETLNLRINNVITYIAVDSKGHYSECLNWTILITHNFQSFANVNGKLSTTLQQECYIDGKNYKEETIVSIHIAILILSILALYSSWNQFYQISKEYMIFKKKIYSESQHEIKQQNMKGNVDWRKNWQDLDIFDKMQFFDFWFVISVAGHFLQLFGSLVALLDDVIFVNLLIFEYKGVLIGFSVMLAWITLIKYLKYNDNVNILTETMSKSSNNLFMFLLGVMPFFMGFVFYGQTIFWKYKKFEDTSASTITLFALVNGDIVNDTFLQTWAQGLYGQVYFIIFILLFYTAVQNIFVTIIMQGYEQSLKEREYKKSVLEKAIKKEEVYDEEGYELKIMEMKKEKSLEEEKEKVQIETLEEIQQRELKENLDQFNGILDEIEKLGNQVNNNHELNQSEKNYFNGIVVDNLRIIDRTLGLRLNELQLQS